MDMPSSAKTYCARLNIPVRRVEEFLDKKDVKLFDLLVVALLERGGPVTLEEIADRLSAAGVQAGTDDMVYSLKKAWHGMRPVYRGPDGRLGLDVACYRDADVSSSSWIGKGAAPNRSRRCRNPRSCPTTSR